MTMTTNDEISRLSAELDRLRRTTRVLTGAVALTPVLALSLALGARPAETVRSERFEVVDGHGVVRASLGFEEGQPALTIYDDEDRARLCLTHEAEQTGLFIRDEDETVRIGVAQFAHGGGGLALHGPESKGAAVLYLKGEGSLMMFDQEGAITSRYPQPGPEPALP